MRAASVRSPSPASSRTSVSPPSSIVSGTVAITRHGAAPTMRAGSPPIEARHTRTLLVSKSSHSTDTSPPGIAAAGSTRTICPFDIRHTPRTFRAAPAPAEIRQTSAPNATRYDLGQIVELHNTRSAGRLSNDCGAADVGVRMWRGGVAGIAGGGNGGRQKTTDGGHFQHQSAIRKPHSAIGLVVL